MANSSPLLVRSFVTMAIEASCERRSGYSLTQVAKDVDIDLGNASRIGLCSTVGRTKKHAAKLNRPTWSVRDSRSAPRQASCRSTAQYAGLNNARY